MFGTHRPIQRNRGAGRVIDAITATIDPYVLHEEMERWGATTFVSKLGEDAVTKTERLAAYSLQ
jgi:hypothetical protein